mmetsp:Transcript_129026/g.251244  ORF Transcript_129026/g.251244 Transcript_129026/m.251244 type:complete len:101 (-) Transcript_129026:1514-1816(-)
MSRPALANYAPTASSSQNPNCLTNPKNCVAEIDAKLTLDQLALAFVFCHPHHKIHAPVVVEVGVAFLLCDSQKPLALDAVIFVVHGAKRLKMKRGHDHSC